MEWNLVEDVAMEEIRTEVTRALERGARNSNCWGALPSNLRDNVALSHLVSAASAAYALAEVARGFQ